MQLNKLLFCNSDRGELLKSFMGVTEYEMIEEKQAGATWNSPSAHLTKKTKLDVRSLSAPAMQIPLLTQSDISSLWLQTCGKKAGVKAAGAERSGGGE